MTRRTKHQLIGFVIAGAVVVLAALGAWQTADADGAARKVSWQRTEVSWYGPGFYGNRFACAGKPGLPVTYRKRTRGTAHRTLPCGTVVVICHRRPGARRYRCVRVKVIDRGPYVRGRDLDATARTAQDLCGCWKPYTMKRNSIRWRVIRHA